jgi:hypothetical protein
MMERTGASPSGATSMRKWTRPRTSRQMARRSPAGNASVENRNGAASLLFVCIGPRRSAQLTVGLTTGSRFYVLLECGMTQIFTIDVVEPSSFDTERSRRRFFLDWNAMNAKSPL